MNKLIATLIAGLFATAAFAQTPAAPAASVPAKAEAAHTKAVVKRVCDAWNDAGALNAWLEDNVGPSTLPPPEFGGR